VGLVSIGEFSRRSRLSPKALRLYDDLGLLVPDHVDAATGYRWYADTQPERARVVALLRRIGVPLAQISNMLALDPTAAAERIVDYWAATEMEHSAQRELVGYLVDRLHGKKPATYDVAVRDIPARSLLSLMRRVHQDEMLAMARSSSAGLSQATKPPRSPLGSPTSRSAPTPHTRRRSSARAGPEYGTTKPRPKSP
jgi:DNA-binding transcriptional MerR regulator